jgi:hypothetical protein
MYTVDSASFCDMIYRHVHESWTDVSDQEVQQGTLIRVFNVDSANNSSIYLLDIPVYERRCSNQNHID